MKRRLFSALLAALPAITQVAPAIAQTTATATLDPNTEVSLPGLYYDPDAPSSTFSQLPGAEQAGYVDVPALPPGVQTPYLLDRAWPQGATPDQILKFGDLQQNPVTAGFTKLSVRQLTASSGTNIGDVPVGDVALLNGLTIQQVDDLYTKINNGEKIKLKDAAPAVQAAFGVLLNPGSAPQQLQNAALTAGERIALEKLSKIPALEGIPLQDLARGNWEGVIDKADQIKLAGIGEKIGPTLKKLPVKQIVPIVGDAIAGDWRDARRKAIALAQQKGTEVAVKELLKEFPQLKDVPIAAIPGVLNQPIDQALPQIADLAVEHIPGAKDKTINSIPGLEDIPINELPFDLAFSFFAGDVFARFDIAYSGVDGPEEPSTNHALSGGSEDQKFKPIKCSVSQDEKQRADNCPHFEMRKFIDSVAETAGLDSDIEGKQWVQGDSGGKNGQGVKGGKGLLKWVNGGWEPAGIHPFGTASNTKFVLKKITEYPDKKSTARLSLAFQFCVTVPILGQQCTPHFLVIPTPFVIKEDGLFLVASRRNLPADIARLRNQTLTAGVYCDPDQLIASTGQSDSGAADTKYGHHAFTETNEQLYNVAAVDGATVGLTKDAAAAFEKMQADAAAQGLDIKAVSGFRSRKLQEELFSDQVAKQGGSPEAAAKISAPAGHSEHHTGLAVDVGNNANPYLNESWANTPEYDWMQQNAGKYGFELSFPKGNSQGVSYEPWHWRYAGSDQAAATFSHTADDGHNHNHGTSVSANGVLQPIDGSTGAPQLKGIPGQPGSVSRRGSTTSTPADPDHNLKQYLARIRIGESTDGTNWIPNSQTGAYGIYQFTPESRTSLMQRTGIDGWTRDRAVAAQAAVEWIKIIGAEENVDLMAAIQRGDFALADRVLSPLQWTSLPGGPEQSEIWSNPDNFQIYGPTGDASTNEPATVASRGIPCKPSQVASVGNVHFEQGSGVASGQLADPLTGQTYVVTSNFGWRTHPTTGVTSFHEGIDLAWDPGTPIKAADGGEVVMSKWNGDYGNFILIDHENGLATWYGHNSSNYVRVGDKVTKGQEIGTVGNTGRSTGPHVDFGVVEGYQTGNVYSGVPVNPRKYVNFPLKGAQK